MKEKEYVIVTYNTMEAVYSCSECGYADRENSKLICCADKLPKKYYTKNIDNINEIPKWCPYRRKEKK
jgi:hypothetical protein